MRQGRADGFALAELLVTLVVLGMIGALIVGGVATGRRVWEHGDAVAAAGEQVVAAENLLRARLERAYPATRYDASAPYSDFDGVAKSVAFLAPDGDAHRPSALRRYTLALNVAGDLVLTSVSDVADPDNPRPVDIVLLRRVETIDLAYFGAAPPDNVPRWRLDWRRQSRLPDAVRLRVQFAQGDRRWWPDLIVHPFATVDLLCTLDLASHRCRGRV